MVKEAIEGKVLVSESEPKEKDEANNTATETSAPKSEKMDEDAPTIFSGSEEMKEGNKEEVKKDTDGENKIEVKKEMNEGNKKEEVNKGKDEDNKEEEAKRQEKEEKKSNKKAGKSRKRNRKKAKPMNADVEAAKDVDKAETSDKKKSSKNVESMGMIFMCNSKTKRDCYQYKVLGLPASKKELVSKVYKGTRLFLFDVDLKLMYGIYKAAGPGGYNIEPKAFKSAFPSQVRFTVLEDCLPLAEEKFKAVIKDNYYGKNKFNCQLTAEQVKNLCKLFLVTTKGSKSKRAGRSSRIETHTFRERDGSRWQGHDGLRHPVLDREVFYPDSVDMHERKGRPLEIRQPPLPPPARQRHPLYAHERPSDVEYYRRDVRIEHHDPRLLDSELRPSDAEYYRRDSHIEHHDPWLLDSELRPSDAEYYRRDSHIEHHDPRLLDLELRRREEISYRDPYRIYREPPIYPAAPLPPLYRY